MVPDSLSLEQRLEASLFLSNLGIKGNPDEIICQLTVDLAAARKANKDLHDMMSNEIARLRARWSFDRDLANDTLDDIVDLEAEVEALKTENGYNIDALITAQGRLDNALEMLDELSPFIDWSGAFNV